MFNVQQVPKVLPVLRSPVDRHAQGLVHTGPPCSPGLAFRVPWRPGERRLQRWRLHGNSGVERRRCALHRGWQLRSNSPGAANYHLSTPSTQATEAQWELFVDLKFSTSGANYVDVYLMSDNADLASGVNGYYVRMGETQDRLELFRSDGGTANVADRLPDGIVNSSSDNPFRIRVKRDVNDLWTHGLR